MKRAFAGDIVIIRLSTRVVLTGYIPLILKYEKPDKTTGHWDASVDPDDATKAQYMTTETDLDIHGTWRIQAYDGQGHGLWAEFKVYEPLYRS